MRKPALQVLITASLVATGMVAHAQGGNALARHNVGGTNTISTTNVAPPPAPVAAAPSPGYANKIRAAVFRKALWNGARSDIRTRSLVRCAPNGMQVKASIVRSSGNPQWDEAAWRAVRQTNPMPVGTNGQALPKFFITLTPAIVSE